MPALRKGCLCLGMLMALAVAAMGQETSGAMETSLTKAIKLSDDGYWEAAVTELEGLLGTGTLSRGQRSQARRVLAEAYISLRKDAEAVAVYTQIIRDDRNFGMRSLGENAPAQLLKNFGQALLQVRDEDLRAQEEQLSRTSGGAAMLRSVVLPGWGQRYLGYRARSYFHVAVSGAAVFQAYRSNSSFRDSRDKYDNAPEGADFDQLYDDYERKADLADLALGIVATAWLANVLDAAVLNPNIRRPTAPAQAILVQPRPANGMQIAYVRKF